MSDVDVLVRVRNEKQGDTIFKYLSIGERFRKNEGIYQKTSLNGYKRVVCGKPVGETLRTETTAPVWKIYSAPK